MLPNYGELDDEQRKALRFRVWILSSYLLAFLNLILLGIPFHIVNLLLYSMIWYSVTVGALLQQKTIHQAASLFLDLISTGFLLFGVPLLVVMGLVSNSFLILLSAILLSVAGVLQAIIVVRELYRLVRGRGSHEEIQLPK
ncbi:hypothetical protein N7467_004177 [Penicillium canescens]|nr:hypothetical protein N7467_004177 [Penicillium canescens]